MPTAIAAIAAQFPFLFGRAFIEARKFVWGWG